MVRCTFTQNLGVLGGRIYRNTYFLLSHKFYCVFNKRTEEFPQIPIIHFTPYTAFSYQMWYKESIFSLNLWIGKKCSKVFSMRYRALRKWVLPSVNPQTCKLPKWENRHLFFSHGISLQSTMGKNWSCWSHKNYMVSSYHPKRESGTVNQRACLEHF